MIVSDIRKRCEGGVARVEARVAWEYVDAPPLLAYVETLDTLASALTPDPNAFLVACLLPAWRLGERRLRIEGELCPVLCERVKTPLGMLRRWHPDDFGAPPAIEATRGFATRTPVRGQAISLLSCGIDSLATLRWNVLHVPCDHPDAIRACAYFELDESEEPSLERLQLLTGPREPVIRAVEDETGVEPIPIRTNLWWLADDGRFSTEKWHGAFLASLVSFFAARFRQGYVASSHSPAVVQPWGSHPLIDPHFSSAHFRVEHDLFSMDRIDKLALVADWPTGLANIRVCQNDDTGRHNCGTCEKCIRTLVQLAALGKLEGAAASFPGAQLTPELIMTIEEYDMIKGYPYYIAWYSAAIPGLRDHGHRDVADALKVVVAAARD